MISEIVGNAAKYMQNKTDEIFIQTLSRYLGRELKPETDILKLAIARCKYQKVGHTETISIDTIPIVTFFPIEFNFNESHNSVSYSRKYKIHEENIKHRNL